MRRRFALVLLLLALTACAGDPGWVNSRVPKDRWKSDYGACRRQADDAVGPGDYYEPDDRSSNPMRAMDRDDSHRRFDAYLAMCMEGKGYHHK